MNPAALPTTLFTAAPPATPPSPGAAGGNDSGQPQARFSQLLDTAEPAGGEPARAAASSLQPTDAAAEPAEQDQDAPWPPAGLETLLAPHSPLPTPQAPITPGLPVLLAAGNSQAHLAGAGAGAGDAAVLLTPTAQAAAAAPTPPLPPPAGPLALSSALAGDEAITAALPGEGQDSTAAMLALNPTTATAASGSLPGVDAAAIASMAAVGATAGASPLPSQDTQASVLPTRADMGGEHFDADVAQGVEYMLDNKLQSARIRISPQQLGMIEVELRLDGDRVHAHFSSAQADVRQALQDSLPRLREMLDAHGMQMGQAAVNDAPAGQQGHSAASQDHGHGNGQPGGDGEPSSAATPAPVWRHNRLLDTYA